MKDEMMRSEKRNVSDPFGSPVIWYINRMDQAGLVYIAIGLIGIPLIQKYAMLNGMGYDFPEMASRSFWVSFYLAVGSLLLLVVVGEHLRILKYQRPSWESTASALCSVYSQSGSRAQGRLFVLAFLIANSVFIIAFSSAIGIQLFKRFLGN